jgi:hypothetical protein
MRGFFASLRMTIFFFPPQSCSHFSGGSQRDKDAVGDGGGFYGGSDVVGADDVGSGEDGGYVGGSGGLEAIFHGGCRSVKEDRQRRVLDESAGKETFARGSGEDG